MLNKVREYRWELWLFFGLPIAAQLAELAIHSIVSAISSGFEEAAYSTRFVWWWDLPSSIAWLALLGVSYRWVRCLDRRLLRLVWQYSLVAVVMEMTLYLVRASLLYDIESLDPITIGFRISWTIVIWFPINLVVLVWFARRVSRGGFYKVLAFVGILAFPGLSTPYFIGGASGLYIQYEIGHVILILVQNAMIFVAVWALKHMDTERAIGGKGLATLFGVAWLSLMAVQPVYVDQDWAWWIEDTLLIGTMEAGFYVIVIGAAYIVRVRLPKQEPPPEEPVDSSTLLYGGGWRDSS